MKALMLAFALQLCLVSGIAIAADNGGSNTGEQPPEVKEKQAEPTQEGVLQLADEYTKKCEPKLEEEDKAGVAEVKKTIADSKFSDVFFKEALGNVLSQLTLKLASAKSLDGLVVASAFLVQEAPNNRRALNLFGSVLHTRDEFKDAIAVFQYTLTLDPDNTLTRLNLANAYLDDDRDEEAKVLLDKLEFDDAGNKAVYRALATYYYKQENLALFREYLLKAAKFKGFKRKKADERQEKVDENEVKQEESTEAMEAKLKELQDIVPLTTADVLEEEYPDAAQLIRDKYGKLAENERWILPNLPMVNLNGPPDYQRNKPILKEWMKVNAEKFSVFPKGRAERAGIDPNASKAVQKQQGEAAARKKMAEAMQQAQQMLEYMEQMPGVSEADIAKAKEKLQKATQKAGVEVEDKPVDMAAPPPGIESGSLFAGENYYNFKRIQAAYTIYFIKYHQEMMAKFMDILRVYPQKIQEENDRFQPIWEKLQEEHRESVANNPDGPHGGTDEPCRREMIDHKKRLNAISDDYYRQWSNLYMPQYAQRMKPNLDAYFNVCMLHIRNMNDPKIMEQEFNTVTMTYTMLSEQSISYMGMGDNFTYYPEVEEEERALEEDIARAKEEAKAKSEEFKQEFKAPEFSFTQWVDDHFVLEVSGEFLSLKVTSKSIEFEAYVPGVGAGAKYDFSEQKFETYTSAGAKLEVGVNICGLGAKAEGGAEVWRRTATWDLANGKYYETDTAKAEAKGSFGPLSAGGEFQLDAQLNAKVTTKVSIMGTATVQNEEQLN